MNTNLIQIITQNLAEGKDLAITSYPVLREQIVFSTVASNVLWTCFVLVLVFGCIAWYILADDEYYANPRWFIPGILIGLIIIVCVISAVCYIMLPIYTPDITLLKALNLF